MWSALAFVAAGALPGRNRWRFSAETRRRRPVLPPGPRKSVSKGPFACSKQPADGESLSEIRGDAEPAVSQSAKMAALLGRNVEEDAARQKEEARRLVEENAAEKRRSWVLAAFSVAVGIFYAIADFRNPESANALLREMEMNSAPISVLDSPTGAIENGKPVLVDFYATWCTNCKSMAPRLSNLERSPLGSKVNFITVDVEKPENSELVDRFQVDGIPHMALIDATGQIRATMIGMVPTEVLRDDLQAILDGQDTLPYPGVPLEEIMKMSY